MKRIYLLLFALVALQLSTFAQSGMGEIRGKVIDGKTKKPLDYVSITLKLGGVTKATTLTEDDGSFIMKTLQTGDYDLYATYLGYSNQIIKGISVTADEIRFVNFGMTSAESGQELKEFVVEYRKPLIDPGGVKGEVKTAKEIMALPQRNINNIAGTTMGVDARSGATPNFRGARAEGTAYYIDGVRVNSGSLTVPQNAIDQVQVITGGTPAQYGDFIGGAISITTKAPTRNFVRSFEAVSASPFNGYLDYSHYNELQAVLSGPLKVINKGRGDQERVLLGFLISGSVVYSRDGRQPAVDLYKVNDAKLKEIEKTPLVPGPGGNLFPAAEFLRKSDLEKINYRQNVASYSVNLQGNVNFQPSSNINVRWGYQASNSSGRNWSHYNSLLNSDNNGMSTNYGFRTYLQMTQTFKKSGEDKKEEASKQNIITNAFYTVRVSYEMGWAEGTSAEHGKNYFDYGHIGTFKTYQAANFSRVIKTFGQPADSFRMADGNYLYLTNYLAQTGFRDTGYSFEQGDKNEIRGNYTKALYDYYGSNALRSSSALRGAGGLINGDNPSGIYSLMWGNVGSLQSNYSKSQTETYNLYVMSEASIAPRSNPKAKHDLQFGITYEQQFRRAYSLNANGLWGLMRLLANRQFSGVDTANPILKFDANGVFKDTVYYNRRVVDADIAHFDSKLREKLIAQGATDVYGKPITASSFLDVNSYSPSTYSLDMFTADELLNQGNSYVSYYGYDHLGNTVKGKPGLDDFLNNTKRLLPAYQPVYFAAWFQDKFVFKDLVLRVGVRAERFDANQPVLRDPYSMVPIYTAGDIRAKNLAGLGDLIPSTIGSDYKVYVDNDNQAGLLRLAGFRNGNNWYDKNGNPVTDPQSIARDAKTNRNIPFMVDATNPITPTKESFKDYQPDNHILPRVWFSFPISTTAQFFGTYDILTQRPGTNLGQIDDYYFLQNRLTGTIANPDLKMTQVTDYEIGFRQQIGTDASLGIITSYREYRNMVQIYRYIQAWPNDYNTFGNLDFATVKSIGLEYNIRDLGNVTLSANYMIQFADGTGSNATSSSSLVSVGLPTLRTIYPLDFDTRHTLKAVFDYHYKTGKDYDGPVVNGKKILENAGINFIFTAYSGRPYTEYLIAIPDGVQSGAALRSPIKGSINGSNLPPQYNVDLNIDKFFELSKKKIDGSTAHYRIRTFLWVQNLFNTANVLSVYRFTGSAYNDGYLTSPQAQEQIRVATDEQSFVDLYNSRMLNPDRFVLPRLTRIGAALYF